MVRESASTKTNKQRIENTFVALEDMPLLRFVNRISNFDCVMTDLIGQSEEARQFIADQRVSMSIFVHAMYINWSSGQNSKPSSSSDKSHVDL